MIISEEQVRLAARYLQTQNTDETPAHLLVSEEAMSDILQRVSSVLAQTPDVREDRIAEARELLAGTMPSTDIVAGKLIGRVISDSLR